MGFVPATTKLPLSTQLQTTTTTMAYNPAHWDNLALDNDSLYAMLQRGANPSALTLDPTRFPAPAVDNPTPPASDDSSPSPPSIKEREQFTAANSAAGRATRRSTVAEDESSKRKVDDISDSDDSSYEQPSKHQHRSSESGVGASGPRRSTGGTKKKSGNPVSFQLHQCALQLSLTDGDPG